MTRLQIRQKIVSLLFDIDNYREARMYSKIRQLEDTIEYLEYMLSGNNVEDEQTVSSKDQGSKPADIPPSQGG